MAEGEEGGNSAQVDNETREKCERFKNVLFANESSATYT